MQKGTLTSLSTREGLSNDIISSLITYKGQVLAGTQNQVGIITPPGFQATEPATNKSDTTWKIGILKGSEGLLRVSNSWNTDIITKNGEYFFGDAGVTIVNDIKEQQAKPPTYVTGISVLNEPQYFTDRLAIERTRHLMECGYILCKRETTCEWKLRPAAWFALGQRNRSI